MPSFLLPEPLFRAVLVGSMVVATIMLVLAEGTRRARLRIGYTVPEGRPVASITSNP